MKTVRSFVSMFWARSCVANTATTASTHAVVNNVSRFMLPPPFPRQSSRLGAGHQAASPSAKLHLACLPTRAVRMHAAVFPNETVSLNTAVHADMVVVGAGAAGLATAIFAAHAEPTLNVICLDG